MTITNEDFALRKSSNANAQQLQDLIVAIVDDVNERNNATRILMPQHHVMKSEAPPIEDFKTMNERQQHKKYEAAATTKHHIELEKNVFSIFFAKQLVLQS